MRIWIDGDACPKAIKQILFRAALKRRVLVIIVANHLASVPLSSFIKRVQVESGFDKADDYIISQLLQQDLVITADIILADQAITKGAQVLSPRGQLYTSNNIKSALTMRHVNESLRESGFQCGRLETISPREIQVFANYLDKIMTAAR